MTVGGERESERGRVARFSCTVGRPFFKAWFTGLTKPPQRATNFSDFSCLQSQNEIDTRIMAFGR